MSAPVIAIDGPSASGKGTIASRVAKRLGFHYLESGALYRVVALISLREDTMQEQRLVDHPAGVFGADQLISVVGRPSRHPFPKVWSAVLEFVDGLRHDNARQVGSGTSPVRSM